MNKLKLFLENFLVYGFGSIISKAVPLLMVPIVTRLMPSSEYFGLSDLSGIVVSIGAAIAVNGMYDAMFRLFFEKDEVEYKQTVCSTAFIFTLFLSVLIFFLLLIFKDLIAELFFNNAKYSFLVYICAIAVLVSSTNSIICAPTRMENKRKVFLVTNTLAPILAYSVSIPMLLKGYYVTALPVAGLVSSTILEIAFGVMNKKWFSFRRFDVAILKQLLVIAIPIGPSFLVYWIFSSCDKVMITNMIGLEAAGIYAVGSKIGTASQLIYMAFAGGWQYFAFSTMKEDNQVKSNSLVFEYLGVISFGATACVCTISLTLFDVLFPKEYLSGFIVAPYLFMSPLILMLYQIIGNQFLVVKITWPTLIILSFGAVVNIALNFLLIPMFGIEGAAVSTLLGYIASTLLAFIVLSKMKLVVISKQFVWAIIFMIIFAVGWRVVFLDKLLYGMIATLIFVMALAFTYKDVIVKLVGMIRNKA